MVDNEYHDEDEEFADLDAEHEDKLREVLGEHIGNILIEHGYGSLESIKFADDAEILDIHGIGTSTLGIIRESVRSALNVGVSDRSATTDSEVKPSNEEADPAEGEIAEPSSAVDAAVVGFADSQFGNVAIRSLWPARIRVTAPSGLEYIWPSAGSLVVVLAADIDFVLGKNRNVGRACCGGSSERIYFELA